MRKLSVIFSKHVKAHLSLILKTLIVLMIILILCLRRPEKARKYTPVPVIKLRVERKVETTTLHDFDIPLPEPWKFVLRDEDPAVLPKEEPINPVDEEDEQFMFRSQDCIIEDWNNITTDTFEIEEANRKMMKKQLEKKYNYLYSTAPSLLAAFAYKDHIAVTMTSESFYGKNVYCRYYDCRRREIPNPFNATVFPEMTVMCGRRPGAEYISVSESLEETPEYPVPIVRRTEPKHHFTVCMATLYGDEPKFIQIADFIEYYKLQGATFFHVYLRNVTDYDRILLDDYVRTGDIEIIKMHDNFWREDFMWHHPQINDCHYRNKYFSKWTAFIDLDERIEMKNEMRTIGEYLDNITDPNIASLVIRIQWVLKEQYSPQRYINDSQIVEEMLFRKFHNTSQIGAYNLQPKCIVRPEKVAVMDIHSPNAMYQGVRLTYVPPRDALVRHYRNNRAGFLSTRNVRRMESHGPFTMTSIDPLLESELTKRVLARVKRVYDIKKEPCDKMQYMFWQHDMVAPCWQELVDLGKVKKWAFKIHHKQ